MFKNAAADDSFHRVKDKDEGETYNYSDTSEE